MMVIQFLGKANNFHWFVDATFENQVTFCEASNDGLLLAMAWHKEKKKENDLILCNSDKLSLTGHDT